ncbi:MAG: fimbria/pilus periplasmic chaperone [Gammaproteobacteria bacterium]|nr:fimbria/pilus periplasmic chaperone [Gammaproteobacteria bacterium]
MINRQNLSIVHISKELPYLVKKPPRRLVSFANLSSLFLALILITGECLAAAQLMVTPTRVVFDGKTRTAQVTVINSGDDSGTYRIELVNKRMTLDGQFEDIETPLPGEQFADNMIRFSPRQVVLEPGKSQIVRLSLRKPANLQAGEYRSHVLFKAIPKDAGTDIGSVADPEKISIKLTAIVSISIPVIVRHGETEASVVFTAVKYQPPTETAPLPSLLMEMQRTGNQSVFGDFLAELVQENGNSIVVAQANGIAIYTPNEKRNFTMSLRIPKDIDTKNSVLKVFYRSPADQGGKILSQARIKLP